MKFPLNLPPGLNSDDTTFAAEGRWADGNNMRFRMGKPESIGSYLRMGTFTLSGFPRKLYCLKNSSGTRHVIYGCEDRLLVTTSAFGAVSNISPVGLGTDIFQWSFATWGTNLLACPAGGKLYEWAGNTGVVAAEIVNAPDQISYMMVTAERQVLALGCNEEVSGTFNEKCIRGSDLEDNTDWTTSATNNAFEHILDCTGNIVAGVQIGPYVAVWTGFELFIGQFIGDPGQAYRFDKVADSCGLVESKAFVVIGQTAYWLGHDFQFRRWTPGGLPEVIACPIWKDFLSRFRVAAEGTMLALPEQNEFIYYYLDYTDSSRRYIAYSISDNCWYRGDIARTAAADLPLLKGASSNYSSTLTAERAGLVYMHELPPSVSGTRPNCYIQSADFYVDEGEREIEIQRVFPDFEGQTGDVSLTLFMKQRPQSSAVTNGPFTLSTTTTKKDMRATGKLAAVKLAGTAVYFRLGKPVFDVKLKGKRA